MPAATVTLNASPATKSAAPSAIVKGPSPRGWGRPSVGGGSLKSNGSIPTRVGETGPGVPAHLPRRVHPHAGGGDQSESVKLAMAAGPSPRGWGRLARIGRGADRDGSIPTRVGETPLGAVSNQQVRVHPHAGGGDADEANELTLNEGPSPRGWGRQ